MNSRPLALIVEDDEVLAERVKYVLENPSEQVQMRTGIPGFRVQVARTSDEADQYLNADEPPEVVLLDLSLPVNIQELRAGFHAIGIGKQLLAKIRLNPRIAVVVFTAHPDEENILHALRHGASDFVIKPLKTRDEEGQLFVRMVKAVGHSREITFRELRLAHERRIAEFQRQRERERFARSISDRMNLISQNIESLEGSLRRKVGIDCRSDKNESICQAILAIKSAANDVYQAGWADASLDDSADYPLVDVADIVHECVETIRPCYTNHDVNLVTNCPGPLQTRSFPSELRQIIEELTFGSLQSSPKGSDVVIEGRLIESPGDIVVTVRRSGAAAPDESESLERILHNIGGRLDVRTEGGQTSLTVRIPVVTHE